MKTVESFSKNTTAEIAGLEFTLEIAVGLIILTMIFSAASAVGDMISTSVEINASNNWAASDIPSGTDIWKNNATFVGLIVLVSIISLVTFYIRHMGME